MTRINAVDPKLLLDQHLMAEYREITRVSGLAKHVKQPAAYTMGTGHVKFFYDKGLFLAKRRVALYDELKSRGYNVTWYEYTPHPEGLNNDWLPDKHSYQISIMRLQEKLSDKPNFYTLRGSKVERYYYLDRIHDHESA